MLERIR